MSYRAYFYTVSTPKLVAEPARYNVPAQHVVFTAFIQADSKAQAERLIRETPRFRKTMKQSNQDWRTVALAVTRTSRIGKVR